MCKFLRSLADCLSVLAFLFGHFIFDSYATYLTLSFDTLYVYFLLPFLLIFYFHHIQINFNPIYNPGKSILDNLVFVWNNPTGKVQFLLFNIFLLVLTKF